MLALTAELEPRTGTGPNAIFFSEVILLATTALYGDHARVHGWSAFFKLNKGPASRVELQGVLELEQLLRTSGHIGHSLRHRVVHHVDVVAVLTKAVSPSSGLKHYLHDCIIRSIDLDVNQAAFAEDEVFVDHAVVGPDAVVARDQGVALDPSLFIVLCNQKDFQFV